MTPAERDALVQAILDAYRATGLRPRPGSYLQEDGACAAGAYVVARRGPEAVVGYIAYDFAMAFCAEAKVSEDFAEGVTVGFDGLAYDPDTHGPDATQDFLEGYEVGHAVRKKVGLDS